MTAVEKARELVDRFNPHVKHWDCYSDSPVEENHAKQCALICVDEILDVYIEIQKIKRHISSHLKYWQDVKKELEKL